MHMRMWVGGLVGRLCIIIHTRKVARTIPRWELQLIFVLETGLSKTWRELGWIRVRYFVGGGNMIWAWSCVPTESVPWDRKV